MDESSSESFLQSLLISLREVCLKCIEFGDCVTINGFLCIDIDGGTQEHYVLSEYIKQAEYESNSFFLKATNFSRPSQKESQVVAVRKVNSSAAKRSRQIKQLHVPGHRGHRTKVHTIQSASFIIHDRKSQSNRHTHPYTLFKSRETPSNQTFTIDKREPIENIRHTNKMAFCSTSTAGPIKFVSYSPKEKMKEKWIAKTGKADIHESKLNKYEIVTKTRRAFRSKRSERRSVIAEMGPTFTSKQYSPIENAKPFSIGNVSENKIIPCKQVHPPDVELSSTSAESIFSISSTRQPDCLVQHSDECLSISFPRDSYDIPAENKPSFTTPNNILASQNNVASAIVSCQSPSCLVADSVVPVDVGLRPVEDIKIPCRSTIKDVPSPSRASASVQLLASPCEHNLEPRAPGEENGDSAHTWKNNDSVQRVLGPGYRSKAISDIGCSSHGMLLEPTKAQSGQFEDQTADGCSRSRGKKPFSKEKMKNLSQIF